MRIVHVFPRDLARGAQIFGRELRDRLDGRPDVHRTLSIFAAEPNLLRPDVRLDVPSRIGRWTSIDPLAAWALRQALKELQADVVVAHGGVALMHAVVSRPPASKLVYKKTGLSAGDLRNQLHRQAHRMLVAHADLTVAVSAEAAREAVELLHLGSHRVVVIPNGRDPAKFWPKEAQLSSVPHVIFVGHLTAKKRPTWVVDIVDQLRREGIAVEATIVGDGPLEQELTERAKSLGIRMLGRRADVPDLLRAADLLVFPGSGEGEGMPGVLIEAGLTGLPVVTTAVSGASTIVENGVTGFVVPIDDRDAMMRRVRQLVNDPVLRANMGEGANDRCRRDFTMEASAARWQSMFDLLPRPTRVTSHSGRHQNTEREQVDRRILYLIDSLIPGGAEHAVVSMVAPLAARGVNVCVVCLHRRPGLQERLTNAGFEVVCLDDSRGWFRMIRQLLALVRHKPPALIHTTLYEANLVGRLVGMLTHTPVVTSLVNVTYGHEQRNAPGLKGWKVKVTKFFDIVTCRRVVRFHAITRSVADVMGPRLHLGASQIDVVPRGRDPTLLGQCTQARRVAVRDNLGVPEGCHVILAAARQEHQKGLDLLLVALPAILARQPNLRVFIAGRPGSQTMKLNELLDRLELRDHVELLGVRGDVPDLMCAADVFVLPSRWEGLGSVLLEAMALGVPIVATDLPPVREVLVDERRATLVPPGLPDSLAEGILATLDDLPAASIRAKMAHQRFCEEFTIDRVATDMVTFYEKALAGTATRR